MQFTTVLFKGQLCILFNLKQIISALNILFHLEIVSYPYMELFFLIAV